MHSKSLLNTGERAVKGPVNSIREYGTYILFKYFRYKFSVDGAK
jgi:hypothetical protein